MNDAHRYATLGRACFVLALLAAANVAGAQPDGAEGAMTSLPRTRHATNAAGGRAVLVVTSGGEAAEEILAPLAAGELSAMDAALAMAFVQIVLSGGSWVSFAGILSAAHYDAASGRVETLDAGFDVPRAETNPRTIPRTGTPSGRATLTPGFMSGAAAAHARYGQADWPQLLAPAIARAAGGVAVSAALAPLIEFRGEILQRSGATRAIFAPDGRLLGEGDTLRQPELAALLERIARDGPATMISGNWAERLVASVRAAGGALSVADLEAYQPRWQAPLHIDYAGARVYGAALPQLSGLCLAESLARLGEGTLRRLGHYTESSESLARLVRASHYCYLRYLDAAPGAVLGGVDASGANGAVAPIPLAERLAGPAPGAPHSDVIVAVDPAGRIAVLCHSINTTAWGTTGLFIDGVSVPDSAAFQQGLVARVGPGGRVPNALAPLIVLRQDEPIVAMGGVGASVSELMLQSTVNLLDFDFSAADTARAPMVLQAIWPTIGRFQMSLLVVSAIVFLPTLVLAAIHAVAGREPLAFSLIGLAAGANLVFGAAIVVAAGYRCRGCLAAVDIPWLLFALGFAATIAAGRLFMVDSVSFGARIGMAIAAIAALAYAPVMRGSLVPINIVETGRFPSDVLRATGLPFHAIERDPPYGYWAGVRIDEGVYEAAVSQTSLDGTAVAR